jgi:hypothetical protein
MAVLRVIGAGSGGEEVAYGRRYLVGVRFQREVPSVEETNDRTGNVALERLGTGRQKERIVLAPHREDRRLVRAEVLLKSRVERDVALVVAEQVQHAISSTTNHAKAEQAKALGFNEVIDTSFEKLGDGVRRITGGYGADIVIDGVGGEVLSAALGALALDGSLTTLGYSAGRKATIDVTNLIWQRASIKSFILFAQPLASWADAWNAIVLLLQSGAIKPIVAKTFPLAEAADALRYLVEGRPFGKVVLTI